jgi:hypothetical protein
MAGKGGRLLIASSLLVSRPSCRSVSVAPFGVLWVYSVDVRMTTKLIAVAVFAIAWDTAHAQQPIPIRTLAPVLEKTTETIGIFAGLRHLPDGRVVVNDALRRRMLVFDATLATYTVSADSNGTGSIYSRQMVAGLYPYIGDSTLWPDMKVDSVRHIADSLTAAGRH